MTLYSKYIISVACLGLVGICLFLLDFSDLSWYSNKEVYWGAIALIALLCTVLVENKAKQLEKRIRKDEDNIQ